MILLEFHNIVCFMLVNYVPFVDEKQKEHKRVRVEWKMKMVESCPNDGYL